MEQAAALSALAMTVSLAVVRPTLRRVRITPGLAAVLGVLALLVVGLLTPRDLAGAAHVQWRPLVTLTAILIMTGVVQDAGAFDRLAGWIEVRARGRTAVHTFTVVFVLAVITASLVNNDAAILILTPLVVSLTRRLYPGRGDVTAAFAFAVFLAPGVAPFLTSNPMNMIVAEVYGIGFTDYAAVMAPIALAGTTLTYVVLRLVFRRVLATATPAPAQTVRIHPHPGERPAIAILAVVFVAYPISGDRLWAVAIAGALASILVARAFRVAPLRKVIGHVSLDILAFLWGIFLVVQALRGVGVAGPLAHLYAATPAPIATIGVVSTLGSAVIDNHPMALLDMMAIPRGGDPRLLLAALVGGDIGPRLLPIGSLAGLLWMDLLRRAGVEIGLARFVRVGTLVLLPTLAISLALLYLL